MDNQSRKIEKPMPFSPAVGCLISFLLAVIPVCLILAAAALVVRGEIIFEASPLQQHRVWVVREGEEQGIGYSRMQRVSGREEQGRVCYRTLVGFLLWKSLQIERQAEYCDCFVRGPSGWESLGECP